MKFLEPTRKPKVIYSDNSLEFGKACEDLSWNHCTSTPHRSGTNGIAERAVRRVKEGTSAVLSHSGLDENWWADSMECYTYLRNIQDLLSDGKTPYERRFGEPFKRTNCSVFFIGWVLPYNCEGPVKNPSMWKESLTWIFPRIRIVRGCGGIWKGDVLVADLEELETMDASEIYSKTLNAKEVISPKENGHFSSRSLITSSGQGGSRMRITSTTMFNKWDCWDHYSTYAMIQENEAMTYYLEKEERNGHDGGRKQWSKNWIPESCDEEKRREARRKLGNNTEGYWGKVAHSTETTETALKHTPESVRTREEAAARFAKVTQRRVFKNNQGRPELIIWLNAVWRQDGGKRKANRCRSCVNGKFTEDMEELQEELQRHTDQDETGEVQKKKIEYFKKKRKETDTPRRTEEEQKLQLTTLE